MKKYLWKWWQASGVVLTIGLIIRNGLLPMLRLMNTDLLPKAEVPLVSLTNFWRILNQHPDIFLALLMELVVVWWIFLLLLMIMLVSMAEINQGTFSWQHGADQLSIIMKQFNWRMWLIALAEFVALAPLFSIAFRTPLLTSMRIPEVILDYGTRNSWLVIITLLIYCGCLLVTLRYGGTFTKLAITAHPQIIRNRKPIWRFWQELIGAGIISWLLNGFLFGVQKISGNNQRALSVACLTIAQVGALLLCSWVIMRWVQMMVGESSATVRHSYRWNEWTLIVLVVVMIETGFNSRHYFQPQQLTAPVTISHRGVANRNGVQNSISALKRTSHDYHPDYVEMDIHETKDHQFVVMHDENLRKLTGVNRRPNQLSLQQLTKLSMHENGQTAKIASFDQYLRVANQLHQKLIIELKTTPNDSPDVVERFNHRYGKLIVQRHYLVHSLDYGVVDRLQSLNPRMTVLSLQAYNLTNSQPQIKGFNNEYSSLNERFINAVHRQDKSVYAWTVNNQGAMKQLINQHIDGIVTDDVPLLQRTIRYTTRHQNDAARYWNYLNPIANLPN